MTISTAHPACRDCPSNPPMEFIREKTTQDYIRERDEQGHIIRDLGLVRVFRCAMCGATTVATVAPEFAIAAN